MKLRQISKQPYVGKTLKIEIIVKACVRQTKMDEGFDADLVRFIGSKKCTPKVIRALYHLTSGRSAYLDGVTLEMLRGLLPHAVGNSIHRSLQQCETYISKRTL